MDISGSTFRWELRGERNLLRYRRSLFCTSEEVHRNTGVFAVFLTLKATEEAQHLQSFQHANLSIPMPDLAAGTYCEFL